MPLTKDFKTTVMARAHHDKDFCNAMLTEAINELLTGDMDLGKAILRDYINAVISFEILSAMLDKNPKSLMRMLGPKGNPTSKSLFDVFHAIQKLKKMKINVSLK
jgi:hypothetical protein